VGKLQKAANGTLPSPWFIAAGFHKPHLPFFAPPEYFEMYPEPSPPEPAHVAVGMPQAAFHSCLSNRPGAANSNWGNFTDIPNDMTFVTPMESASAARLRRGYSASVSYTDANIGKVLAAADAVRESTVVVLIGDHGWSLGEGNLWCKMTNNENGARVPLMFRPPGYSHGGAAVTQLAEAVDLYKTLADLSGIGAHMVEDGVDGVSLAAIIANPGATSEPPLRIGAKTQFPRCFNQTTMARFPSNLAPLDRTDCQDIPRELFDMMGYSIRTAEWRYTEWRRWDGSVLRAVWDGAPIANELYFHGNDSTLSGFATEKVNTVNVTANKGVVSSLAQHLRVLFHPTDSAPSAARIGAQ